MSLMELGVVRPKSVKAGNIRYDRKTSDAFRKISGADRFTNGIRTIVSIVT